jgi:hypothetical protein
MEALREERHDRAMSATPEPATPAEAAAVLKAWLERRGATVSLTDDDEIRCDLNGAHVQHAEEAEQLACLVMALRDELRQVLRDERTTH